MWVWSNWVLDSEPLEVFKVKITFIVINLHLSMVWSREGWIITSQFCKHRITNHQAKTHIDQLLFQLIIFQMCHSLNREHRTRHLHGVFTVALNLLRYMKNFDLHFKCTIKILLSWLLKSSDVMVVPFEKGLLATINNWADPREIFWVVFVALLQDHNSSWIE